MRVIPRASAERIGPFIEGVLELRVTRPAVSGEATEAARRLLAAALGLPPSMVRLVAGHRSRLKRFEVEGMTTDVLAAGLRRYRRLD